MTRRELDAADALLAAERVAIAYGWPWDGTRAVAHLRPDNNGSGIWAVSGGGPSPQWLDEEIDDTGRCLLIDRATGELVGVETARSRLSKGELDRLLDRRRGAGKLP
jgi:hypothetical protein